MLWHVDPLGEFYTCNESTVVYFDHASGDTHLLGEFAAHMVRKLAEQPMTIDQLLSKIEADVDPAGRNELKKNVPDLLDELLELGVVGCS
jgi:PqqD family protein of HPr-rel-A system